VGEAGLFYGWDRALLVWGQDKALRVRQGSLRLPAALRGVGGLEQEDARVTAVGLGQVRV
jgi:hypothetical protein